MYKGIWIVFMVLQALGVQAQPMHLEELLAVVRQQHPVVKMYDAEVRSMDASAKGARSWMAPEFGTGFFMTPYNTGMWKRDAMGNAGMGQYMISAQQLFPGRKKQEAQSAYMLAMSAAEKENKEASLNALYAQAKGAYFEWVVLKKKLQVVDRNQQLLQYMIKNAEIRYRNGQDKISAYYKAKAALGNLDNIRLMIGNEIRKQQVRLNTLMNRPAETAFEVDTTYVLKDYTQVLFDSTRLVSDRSDLRAIDADIRLTALKQDVERAQLRPDFGVQYEHMFGFGGGPMQFSLMAMVKVPMPWSTRMNKANLESLKWRAESLRQQKLVKVNELTGMAFERRNDMELKRKQFDLFRDNILPALRRNYQTVQLAYEQNTEELFMLYDAWDTLNMTELSWLDILNELLLLQVDLEEVLEVKS